MHHHHHRDVTIYKLIGEDTIEENMLRVGERKLELEKELVGNQAATGRNIYANILDCVRFLTRFSRLPDDNSRHYISI